MNADPKELSIILPAYNEGPRIHANLLILKQKIDSLKITYEIIIVNDGSSDNTLSEAQSIVSDNMHVLSYEKHQGKGYAVKKGMLHSSGHFKLFMDVDLSTSLDAVEEALDMLKEDKQDIVIGNRRPHAHLQEVQQSFYRQCLGKAFTEISNFWFGCRIADFTCGFKMYTKGAADIVFQRQKIFNWAFDAELIYIALLHHLSIAELAVHWRHHEGSKVRPLSDIVSSLRGLIQIRINALKGLYR